MEKNKAHGPMMNIGFKAVSLTDLVNVGRWYRELQEKFESEGDTERADYFRGTVDELVLIINFIGNKGVQEITNHTLPEYNVKALTMDTSRIVDEVKDAQDIAAEVIDDDGKAKANATDIIRNNPAVRAKINAYEDRRIAYANDNKLMEFNLLFARSKDPEMPMEIVGIRNHIEYYLRNGKRDMLIPYLINIVFEHKKIDLGEAHAFLNRFKEVFGIKEPNMDIKNLLTKNEATGDYELPRDVWLKVVYSTIDDKLNYKTAYMMRRSVHQANILFDTKFKKTTLIHHVKTWRRATIEEVRTEVMKELVLDGPAYKLTKELYGRKFKNFEEVKYDHEE